ncbi:hypothetical protein M9H77_18038 [Catharanthus roseus]|uniref:Uncharacterized protein n=1 Tax=Catharanthus roseus TaxID=4058 RepID=A0ACC0B6B6_CATRO|nr:hypothetical protein M9H77_18038 [Catharanthus roseus]
MDMTSRVQGHTVTTSSRAVRGRHSTSHLPSTSNHLPASFYYDTGAPRSRPALPSHLSHTPVTYEAYGSTHPPSHPLAAVYDPYLYAHIVHPHIPYRSSAQEPLNEFNGPTKTLGAEFFEQMVGAVPPNSSYSIHDYTAIDYSVSSSEPFIGRHSADMYFEGDMGLGEEHDRARSLHIDGEAHERVDGDGVGDDHDDSEDAGDEEQPVPMAPVAPARESDGRPHHEEGKGLTGSFMSVMSKILGSRNKRLDKARDIPAPTQRKKVKVSNWEQPGPAEGACSLHKKAVATEKFFPVRVIPTASNSGILYLN